MELTAYLHPGWAPLVRPAPATRAWMDGTPESFAYRCLPLNIANAHGWEVLSPCGFSAIWDGGTEPSAVTITLDEGTDPARAPVSLFGQGIVTFHIEAIFRTPPGWNLWIGGSPNRAKDAIAPLTGIIETDWSPFTFTMNWRFTRPGTAIRFEPLEPFGFLFPLQRTAIEAFEPAFAPLDADPATAARFQAWSAARDAFHVQLQRDPPKAPADRWQKHYYRGEDVAGEKLVTDHRTKLKLRAFDRSAAAHVPVAPMDDAGITPAAPPEIVPAPVAANGADMVVLQRALDKREWLLEALEKQRTLAPDGGAIERRSGMGADEFLKDYYAPARPVILGGAMDDWPALKRWSPAYLKELIGAAPIEYQGGRSENARFELDKDQHRRTAPFDAFIDMITGAGAGNDAYLTAYNSDRNQQALAPMIADMGFVDTFLARDAAMPNGMPWIGPAGTVTSLHHDLTNNFIAQIVGRKRLKLVPAAQVGRLYNTQHVFSEIADLEDPALDPARYPALAEASQYDVLLEPGEILFVPLGWWHQVKSIDFYGLFQFKAREPLPADDPNKDLFVNQGAGRRVGGKFKELYVRYDTWRVGKFVQNFGRAYVLLPGPFSADFIEEPDQGYEPSEMLGIEKLHVFGSEKYGWQQISVSAFMVDRSPLHRSFPYDEGQIHYKDGGVGNTHLPTNVMVTYDALNVPVGHGAQATFQASAIRWGRTFGVPRGEFWTTLGGDVSIPLGNSVRKTLQRKYTEVHLYVEGARRANFQGLPGRDRNYVTEAGEFLRGPWQIDMSATQRWTTDPLMPTQQDRIYTGTIGRNFASQSLLLLSVARERVADRSGVYAGIRLVQTFTACARCARGAAY